VETASQSGLINYTSKYDPFALNRSIAVCKDTDGDGVMDINDIDDDNDGVLDVTEFTSCTAPLNAIAPTTDGATADYETNKAIFKRIAGTSSKSTVIASTTASGGDASAAGTLVPFARNLTVAGASTAVTGDAATVTWSYTDADSVKISTAAIPFTVGGTSATSVAASFDQAEYAIGDLVTMTLTVKDSKSNSVADGSYFLFDTTTGNAFTTSAQLTSAPFGTGVVSVVGGVGTATFYAPYTTGEFKMTAKMTSHSTVATAAQATSLTASTNVGGADATASLALDAANAATDAANNAYDEAQNATQAASDALAAVTALAAQVKSLIASVKKLTAAVAKLKK
jgi:hypothetical protein